MHEQEHAGHRPEPWSASRGATVRLGKYHGTLGQPSMRMDDRDLAFAAWHIFTTHNRGQIDQILLSCDEGIGVHLERLVARHGRRR